MNDCNPYDTSSVVGSQWGCESMGLPEAPSNNAAKMEYDQLPDPSEPHGFPQEGTVECSKVESLSDTESGDDWEAELKEREQPEGQYEIFHSSGPYQSYKERCLAAAERLFEPMGMNLADDPKCIRATNMFKLLKTTFEIEEKPKCFPDDSASDAFKKTRAYATDTTNTGQKPRKRGRPPKRVVQMFDVVVGDDEASAKRQK